MYADLGESFTSAELAEMGERFQAAKARLLKTRKPPVKRPASRAA